MDFDQAAKQEADMELVRREMARISRDIIRVYNPLDFPFKFKWDSYPQSIPAKGTKDIERYLAMAYLKKIAQYMIGEQIMLKGKELLELREKQLGKQFLDKYEENKEVWDKTPKMNDPELIKAIGETVILGLVEEYGMEDVVDNEQPLEKKDTPYDDAYKLMNRPLIDDEPMRPLKGEQA